MAGLEHPALGLGATGLQGEPAAHHTYFKQLLNKLHFEHFLNSVVYFPSQI